MVGWERTDRGRVGRYVKDNGDEDTRREFARFTDGQLRAELTRAEAGVVDAIKRAAHAAVEGHKLQLRAAETFAVSEDMQALTDAAQAQLPLSAMSREDLPSEYGFVLLPTSLLPRDKHGLTISNRIFVWCVVAGEIHVSAYSDVTHQDDYQDGRDVAIDPVQALRMGARYLLAATWTVPFDRAPTIETGTEWTDPAYLSIRWLMTFWLLCKQTFGSIEPIHVDRAARRRWERLTHEEPKVRIVRLRRRHAQSTGHSDVVWHHSWIVRGHWRQQPYGPGRSLVKAIWIGPYTKGPEDAPLLTTDKVQYLVR